MLHLPEGRGRGMKVKVEWKLAPVDFRRGGARLNTNK